MPVRASFRAACGVGFCLALFPPVLAARVYFDAPYWSAILDIYPVDVVAVDLDGDARQDLVMRDADELGLYVQLATGNGEFALPLGIGLTGVRGFAVGDLDGDTQVDVAAACGSSGLAICRGRGDGTFDPPAFSGLGYDSPSSVTLGDTDGDARLDVAVSFAGVSFIIVHRQVLPGLFFGATSSTPGLALQSIALGRFDSDNVLDLAGCDGASHSIGMLHGNGDGTFTWQPSLATPVQPRDLASADLNSDGRADLVATGGSGWTSVYVGLPAGGFGPRTDFAAVANAARVRLAHVNADAHLDAVVASPKEIAILHGNGAGGFASSVPYPDEIGASSLVVLDVTLDGRPDVLTGRNGTMAFHLQNVDGTFDTPPIQLAIDASDMELGDFDGDGLDDVVLARQTSVAVLLNDGDGRTWSRTDIPIPYAVDVEVGDVNGDGSTDILTCDTWLNSVGSQIYMLLGHGDGTFTRGPDLYAREQAHDIVLGRVDGDSVTDIVALTNGSFVVYRGGTFEVVGESAVGAAGDYRGAIGDVDGDGNLDVAYAEIYGLHRAFVKLGDGQGDLGASISLGGAHTSSTGGLEVVDFDGDGDQDVVMISDNDATMQVRLGNGDGTFVGGAVPNFARDPVAFTTVDLDGNGLLDLVTSDEGPAWTASLTLQEPGEPMRSLQHIPLLVPTPTSWGNTERTLAIGNLNGDAAPDLVAHVEQEQTLSVVLGHAPITSDAIASPSGRASRVWARARSGVVHVGFALEHEAQVRLTLYDVRGRLVQVLEASQRAAGTHEIVWRPQNDRIALRNGVYFVQLQSGSTKASTKLVFLAR